MKRWYLAASVLVALSSPAALLAQTGGTGFSGGSPSSGGSGFSGSGSGSSTGLAGTANTTLLGSTVNTSFNSVFGSTSAALVNTTANPFGAYVAPVSSSSNGGSSSGFSNSFMGGSSGSSGLGTGSGGLAGGLGGATGNRSSIGGLSSGGLTGSSGTGGLTGGGLGGGLGGSGLGGAGLGGNRGGLGGGLTGGNRNMMGGGNLGGGFQGGAGSFLGGMNNTTATMGYQVNFEGRSTTQLPANTTITPNADFQQRLAASPGMLNASGLQVFTRGETAILRGQVGSDYAKQLAAAMIRLEPGVYDVQNELVVAPPKQ